MLNCGSGHTCVTLQNWHNENLAGKRRKFETVADMLYYAKLHCVMLILILITLHYANLQHVALVLMLITLRAANYSHVNINYATLC